MDMGDRDHGVPRRRGSKVSKRSTSGKPGSLAGHLTSDMSDFTRSIASNLSSNIASNLTGRSQANFPTQNNSQMLGPNSRRASLDFKVGSVSSASSKTASDAKPLTMNHLLRGKTALTSKTKRVMARSLVVVPPVAKKMDRKRRATNISPHHPQPPIVYSYPSPLQPLLAQPQQPLHGPPPTSIDRDLIIPPAVQSRLAAAGHPCPTLPAPESAGTEAPETLLWKDAHRRRRASLPCGVKLLEGTGRTSSLPDTVGEEGSSMESPSDSTSTELCDDEEIKEAPDLPTDVTTTTTDLPTDVTITTITTTTTTTTTALHTPTHLDDSSGDVQSSSSELYECPSSVMERLSNKDNVPSPSNDSVVQNSAHPSDAKPLGNHLATVPEKPFVEFDPKKHKNSFRTDEVINVINEVKARKRSKEMNAIILSSLLKNEENRSGTVNLDASQPPPKLSVLTEPSSKINTSDVHNLDVEVKANNSLSSDKQEAQEKVAAGITLHNPNDILKSPVHELQNTEASKIENNESPKQDQSLPALNQLKGPLENSDNQEKVGSNKKDESSSTSENVMGTEVAPLRTRDADFTKTTSEAAKEFENGTSNDTSKVKQSENADLQKISPLEVMKNTASIFPASQYEEASKKSPSLSELSQASENSPCRSNFKSGLTPMSTSLSEAWANLANLSLESPKLTQQSPVTLSRSSSISKRSRSSSSISPRSPRISLYEDDSSVFELCKEAESIRQYIDSEFLSNLLLKGEREKIEKKKSKESQSCKIRSSDEKIVQADSSTTVEKSTTKDIFSNRSEEKFSTDVPVLTASETTNENREGSSVFIEPSQKTVVSDDSPVNEEAFASEGRKRDEGYSPKVPSKLDITPSTVIKVDGHEVDTVTLERSRLVPNVKAKSDPNSPQARDISLLTDLAEYPATHLHPLSSQDLGLMDVVSPAGSPSPSPTFSKSSFALNSQFLRSLSASTQELLNSLVVTSSLDLEEQVSPETGESVSQMELRESKDIELALPTLAPSTSRAICKLFNAAGELSPSNNVQLLNRSLENIDLSSDGIVETFTENKNGPWKVDAVQNGWVRELNDSVAEHAPSIGAENTPENFLHVVDEDILRHERALDEILAPNSLDEMPLAYSQAPQSLQCSQHEGIYREVPTLQELASASLPSAHPVSTAIISFNADDHRTVERTHLKRRFNSPDFRNTQSPRLSLRDKFERDLRSKPRAKHSKSLSKNARFQKGPKSRVNSQENVEKSNKLDKSKSESRIGESANNVSDEYPSDETIRSDGSLECKKQTTVKFAPLNIEIPHYREPEIEEPPLDDRISDVEDFMSPSDEITAEMIRKRLWAGLRSFSVDVDILQAYGILTNSGESFQSNLLCSLSEHPANENEIELQRVGPSPMRKTSMTAEDVEFLETRRNTKRRGSVAALQELVKENTLVIDRILKQKKNDKETKKMNASEERLAVTDTSEAENNGIDKKTSRLLDEAILRTSQDIRERLLSLDSKSPESAASPSTMKPAETPSAAIVPTCQERASESSNSGDVSEPYPYHIKNEDVEANQSSVPKLKKEHEVLFPTDVGSKPSPQSKNEFLTGHDSVVTLKSISSVETTLLPEISKPISDSDYRKEQGEAPSPKLSKSLIVTQHEGVENDSGCFKLPLSAFCVSSSTSQTRVTDSETIIPLSANPIIDESKLKISPCNKVIVFKDPDSPCRSGFDDRVRLKPTENLLELQALHIAQFSSSEAASETPEKKTVEKSAILTTFVAGYASQKAITEHPSSQTTEELPSNECEARNIVPEIADKVPTRGSDQPRDDFSSKSSEESSYVSTVSDDSSSRQSSTTSSSQKLYLPLSPSISKSLVPRIPQSDGRSPTWSKIPSPCSEPNMEPRNRPITFNPFPPRTTSLHRKEVSLKLGLYSPVSK